MDGIRNKYNYKLIPYETIKSINVNDEYEVCLEFFSPRKCMIPFYKIIHSHYKCCAYKLTKGYSRKKTVLFINGRVYDSVDEDDIAFDSKREANKFFKELVKYYQSISEEEYFDRTRHSESNQDSAVTPWDNLPY